MATDIQAKLRFSGISAQKARLVVDLVRGKPAVDAMNTLKFMPQNAAHAGWQTAGFGCGECRRKFWGEP